MLLGDTMKVRLVTVRFGILAIVGAGLGHVARTGLASNTEAHATASETALGRYDFSRDPEGRTELPGKLTEISGLAVSEDGRMFAHGDERATISEVNASSRGIVKSFALGDRVIRGDFEGLAVANGRFYMVTSDGGVYEAAEGKDGERVPFELHTTGLGAECEIEGLGYDPSSRTLLLACKECRKEALCNSITVFRWSVVTKTLARTATLRVPFAALHSAGLNSFNPSGIERDPQTGNYLLIAAKQRAIIEITPAGKLVASAKLAKRWHRQSEGIAVLPDLTLAIGDEGVKKQGRGSLTLYASRVKAGTGNH